MLLIKNVTDYTVSLWYNENDHEYAGRDGTSVSDPFEVL